TSTHPDLSKIAINRCVAPSLGVMICRPITVPTTPNAEPRAIILFGLGAQPTVHLTTSPTKPGPYVRASTLEPPLGPTTSDHLRGVAMEKPFTTRSSSASSQLLFTSSGLAPTSAASLKLSALRLGPFPSL